jgi:hypothetical protein
MAPSSAVPGKQKPIVLKHPAAPGFWTTSPVAAAASAVTTPVTKHAANTALTTAALTTHAPLWAEREVGRRVSLACRLKTGPRVNDSRARLLFRNCTSDQ